MGQGPGHSMTLVQIVHRLFLAESMAAAVFLLPLPKVLYDVKCDHDRCSILGERPSFDVRHLIEMTVFTLIFTGS